MYSCIGTAAWDVLVYQLITCMFQTPNFIDILWSKMTFRQIPNGRESENLTDSYDEIIYNWLIQNDDDV